MTATLTGAAQLTLGSRGAAVWCRPLESMEPVLSIAPLSPASWTWTRTRWLLAAATVLVLLLAPSGAPVVAQDDAVTVRIGLHAPEKNLNPFILPQALPITHDFTNLVYDSLFWSQARLDPEPWLATGAEPSEDMRTWTVTLREGVAWHDGEAFTAEDVAFTYAYFAEVGGPGRYGHHVYDHPVFESAEVIDDSTVTLTFEEPVATFTLLPGGDVPILPEHIWAGIEDPGADATSLPVGTGPFRMTEYEPDTSYRLEANEDYFLGVPTVDVLELTVVPDAQAAFAALQGGELDWVTRNVPAPLEETIATNPDLEVIEGTRFESMYLMFNTRKPALADPVVRRALSQALDLDAMVEIIEGGRARPGNDTWTHPDSPWAHPEGGHTFDVAAAEAALDEAGYALGEDGIRTTPDGAPVAFELLVNTNAPPQIRAGELVAEQLAVIGVDVTVTPLDPPAIGAARQPGPDGPPPVDMFIAVFEAHAHADPDHLFFFFHSPGRGVGGVFSGLADDEFDALVEEALPLPAEDKLPVIHEAQERFAELAPAVTLLYPDGRWAYRPAAYDGWMSDNGHGVFTKRSFLPDRDDVAAADPTEEGTDAEATTTEEVAVEEATPTDDPTDAPTEGSTDAPAADIESDEGGGGVAVVVVLVALVAIGGVVALLARKRSGTVVD